MNPTDSNAMPSRQTLDEASAWFVDFRVGDMDLKSREAFNAWLRRSPEHIRAYLQIAETYSQVPALKDRPALNVNDLLARARADGNVFPIAPAPTERRESVAASTGRVFSRFQRPIAAAAGIVMLIAVAFFAYKALNSPTYTTAIGEQRQITLDDGSTVVLNARSSLRARLTKDERKIDLLSGQALFDVAKDSARPFTVRSQGTVIRAVGTQFDVYQRKSGTTVTVVEGRVSVVSEDISPSDGPLETDSSTFKRGPEVRAHRPAPTYLSAGEQAIVASGAVQKLDRAVTTVATAWTRRKLVFDGSPLTDVADEFNRYNKRELIIRGRDAESFHVSGVYSSTDPASLIRFLKAQPGIHVQETSTEVVVSRE